jgi:hypothetical protein
MAGDVAFGIRIGAADQSSLLRERARKARAIATRYHGEEAAVLIEIADDFEARATSLEAQAG